MVEGLGDDQVRDAVPDVLRDCISFALPEAPKFIERLLMTFNNLMEAPGDE